MGYKLVADLVVNDEDGLGSPRKVFIPGPDYLVEDKHAAQNRHTKSVIVMGAKKRIGQLVAKISKLPKDTADLEVLRIIPTIWEFNCNHQFNTSANDLLGVIMQNRIQVSLNTLTAAVLAFEIYRVGEQQYLPARDMYDKKTNDIELKLAKLNDEPTEELRNLLSTTELLVSEVSKRSKLLSDRDAPLKIFWCLEKAFQSMLPEREVTPSMEAKAVGKHLEDHIKTYCRETHDTLVYAYDHYIAAAQRHLVKRRRQVDMLSRRMINCYSKVAQMTGQFQNEVRKSRRMFSESLRQMKKISEDLKHISEVLQGFDSQSGANRQNKVLKLKKKWIQSGHAFVTLESKNGVTNLKWKKVSSFNLEERCVELECAIQVTLDMIGKQISLSTERQEMLRGTAHSNQQSQYHNYVNNVPYNHHHAQHRQQHQHRRQQRSGGHNRVNSEGNFVNFVPPPHFYPPTLQQPMMNSTNLPRWIPMQQQQMRQPMVQPPPPPPSRTHRRGQSAPINMGALNLSNMTLISTPDPYKQNGYWPQQR